MGKAAREDRRTARRADPAAAAVAHGVERAVESALGIVEGFLSRHGKRLANLDAQAVADIRDDYRRAGYDWPQWCYLPGVALAALLADQAGLEASSPDLLTTSMALTVVAAWWPGRIAVRFDADLLDELLSARLEGDLPVELLERLPAWGLYLDCPHLGPGAGVLACLEPGGLTAADGSLLGEAGAGTELWLAFSLRSSPGPYLALTSVWVGRGSISEALDAQSRQTVSSADAYQAGRAVLEEALGRPYPEVMGEILALLLYLCTTDPDLTHRPVLSSGRRRGRGTRGEITVVDTGFRIGAALRAARAQPGPTEAPGGAGRRVRPHLRSAHFHSYWLGPRSDPDHRHLELRWLPPIPVNVDSQADGGVVVRHARNPTARA